MKARIEDRNALDAVSPVALSVYARAAGWEKTGVYGDHSDVYDAKGLPEIILPRTQRLGDYGYVVSQLIEIFARVAELDELGVYRELVTADRDVIRVRAEADEDGAVSLSTGVELMRGAYDLLLAAACSLETPRPLYRAGANKQANDFMSKVRLGQTEQGSFVVNLLTPVISPRTMPPLDAEQDGDISDDPIERKMTRRLSDALGATRSAAEQTAAGDSGAFSAAVQYGASANLCDALAQIVQPFPAVDISLVWARTRPMRKQRDVVRFAQSDAPILKEAAREFRNREPKLDERVFGYVHRLKRDESTDEGTVTLRALIGEKTESVAAVLAQADYERAVDAHKKSVPVLLEGDLERSGQRWRLRNSRIVEVFLSDGAFDEPD